MKRDLAKWSPDYLKTLYTLDLERLAKSNLSQNEKKVFDKRIDALYRLGTLQDMKEVWSKLLAKDLKQRKHKVDKGLLATKLPTDNEHMLIDGIHELIWLNSYGIKKSTPSDKTRELSEISKKIKELQKLIKKSSEASYETNVILENFLHKKNFEYRIQNGETLTPPTFHGIKYIEGDINIDLLSIFWGEEVPWLKRTQAQRLGWWAKEAIGINFLDLLDYYTERMSGYSKIYKNNYSQFQPKLIKGLKVLMRDLYGSPLEDYVGRIASAILNKEVSKDYVRGYKK